MSKLSVRSHSYHPRVQRTRKQLGDALIRLTLKRGFDNITIRALVTEAKVSYASFHRHFSSIEELLETIVFPVWDALQKRTSTQSTLYDESFELFYSVKTHPAIWRVLLRLPKDNVVRQAIDQANRASRIARWKRHAGTAVPFDFAVTVFEDVTDHLIGFYLDNIDTYTPEQMASMHFDLTIKSASGVLKLRDGWVLAPDSTV